MSDELKLEDGELRTGLMNPELTLGIVSFKIRELTGADKKARYIKNPVSIDDAIVLCDKTETGYQFDYVIFDNTVILKEYMDAALRIIESLRHIRPEYVKIYLAEEPFSPVMFEISDSYAIAVAPIIPDNSEIPIDSAIAKLNAMKELLKK